MACPGISKPVERELRLTPPSDKSDIEAIAGLLSSRGLDAGDFIELVNALGNIKKREQQNIENQESKDSQKDEKKIFVDKEFVFDTRTDVFIYRDGRTKSGRYHMRIYDNKTKKVHKESLWTSNRIEALAKAEKIYAENKDRMQRGVKLISLTTKELVDFYLKERYQDITTIPKAGITHSSYDNLIKQLKHWQTYIKEQKCWKKKIEDIPTDVGRGFGQWLLQLPKDVYRNTGERSRQTINHNIAAVKKMYKDVALEQKYITAAEMPQFKYLKVQPDDTPKRDVFTEAEFNAIKRWMSYHWLRDAEIDETEKLKRQLYAQFFVIHHYTGARSKEILGIKWEDVNVIKTDTKENKKFNRSIYIPSTNSKTGKSRHIVAPVAEYFDRIKRVYKSLGIECNRSEYVFQHISKTKRGKNLPWGQPLIDKRLKSVCKLSADDGIWSPEGRNITNYSARHYYATTSLMRKVNIYDLAINMGTSVNYIEKTYSHVTALMKSAEITKEQGVHKVLDRIEDKEAGYEVLENGKIKQGNKVYGEFSTVEDLDNGDKRITSYMKWDDYTEAEQEKMLAAREKFGKWAESQKNKDTP